MENLAHSFTEITSMIQEARNQAYRAVNKELINLYWKVGGHLHSKLQLAQWGDKTMDELAAFIRRCHPELKGFDKRGLYRMRQFFETYKDTEFVSPLRPQFQDADNQILSLGADSLSYNRPTDIRDSLLTKLTWTHHRTLMARCTSPEERLFYIHMSIKENYTVRNLDRQISSSLFERTMMSKHDVAKAVKIPHPLRLMEFRDRYVLEFLHLPEDFSEQDLRKMLVAKMKDFILELGSDFIYMGQEFRLQVGEKDYFLDLLFYHRKLRCLICLELKTGDFSPAHLGQLNFYLEALDRDVKRSSENPSIGILLCKNKDKEVVEYAMSRQMSPTLISQYQMVLPDKGVLRKKLFEILKVLRKNNS